VVDTPPPATRFASKIDDENRLALIRRLRVMYWFRGCMARHDAPSAHALAKVIGSLTPSSAGTFSPKRYYEYARGNRLPSHFTVRALEHALHRRHRPIGSTEEFLHPVWQVIATTAPRPSAVYDWIHGMAPELQSVAARGELPSRNKHWVPNFRSSSLTAIHKNPGLDAIALLCIAIRQAFRFGSLQQAGDLAVHLSHAFWMASDLFRGRKLLTDWAGVLDQCVFIDIADAERRLRFPAACVEADARALDWELRKLPASNPWTICPSRTSELRKVLGTDRHYLYWRWHYPRVEPNTMKLVAQIPSISDLHVASDVPSGLLAP
jgi:hypothetical protein